MPQTTTSGRLRGEGSGPAKFTDGTLNRFERCLDTVKSIPIEQVAPEYGDFKLLSSGRLLGNCLSPDHTDATPSMTIFTDTQRFKCFGCGAAGDVIDLEMMAGNHDQLWTAMIALSVRYGVELPARSEKWRQWQGEKHAIEDLGEHVRFQIRCRRLFKVLVLNSPEIQAIEDLGERKAEIALCWKSFTEGMRDIERRVKRQRVRRLSQ